MTMYVGNKKINTRKYQMNEFAARVVRPRATGSPEVPATYSRETYGM